MYVKIFLIDDIQNSFQKNMIIKIKTNITDMFDIYKDDIFYLDYITHILNNCNVDMGAISSK